MALAIFDLDNTLLAGDSDYLWGQFLVKNGKVDAQYYAEKNQFFYEQYQQGRLIIEDFLAFSLYPLSQIDMAELKKLHQAFMQQEIIPIITDKSRQLLQKHRSQGDYLLIITATNLFITEPIARYLQVDDIIATNPEIVDGQFTGKVAGLPSYQQGKITRLQQWLQQHPQLNLQNSYFYSDSINDLPLLERVTHPVVVDPDEKLAEHARQKNWPVISLR